MKKLFEIHKLLIWFKRKQKIWIGLYLSNILICDWIFLDKKNFQNLIVLDRWILYKVFLLISKNTEEWTLLNFIMYYLDTKSHPPKIHYKKTSCKCILWTKRQKILIKILANQTHQCIKRIASCSGGFYPGNLTFKNHQDTSPH